MKKEDKSGQTAYDALSPEAKALRAKKLKEFADNLMKEGMAALAEQAKKGPEPTR